MCLVGQRGNELYESHSASPARLLVPFFTRYVAFKFASPWTVGLITYETTMLGAVLATLAGLLVELGLPNFKKLPYDESVVDGGVVVAVKSTEHSKPSIQDVVNSAGAVKVNWV